MPFLMKQQFLGREALFDRESHDEVDFFSGAKLPGDFQPPVQFSIDLDSPGRRLPTLFTTPAFVAKRSFSEILLSNGVDNIELIPATITNHQSSEAIEDYCLINILGLYSAADLQANGGFELAPNVLVLDEPILKKELVRDLQIFRLAEDPIQIIVSDKIADVILKAGLVDVYLERLKLI